MARVLIADDDPDQLQVYHELFQSAGHEVALAWGCSRVLPQTGWADLIMMDLRMPEAADGIALIRHIRESGCEKPLIVVSGWPDELYGQPEERMVSRILVKPVPIVELFGIVRELSE